MGFRPNTISVPAGNLTGTLGATNGGTSQSSYTTGDTLYASTTNTLSKLAVGSNGQVLTLSAGVPSWAAASGGTLFKQYVAGTTYTNGTPTITSTGMTLDRGVLVPYQTSDGAWRLKFDFSGVWAAQGTNNEIDITVTGVVFKNVTGYDQAISVFDSSQQGVNTGQSAFADPNTALLVTYLSSTRDFNHRWGFAGDVELNAKPTWAD